MTPLPIFITGVPRSGTSLVAQLIKECNIFSGKISKMQENLDLLEFEQSYYLSLGGDSEAQFPIIDTEKLLIPNNWRAKVEKILLDQGYKVKIPWMYKSHLLALIWPVWKQAFPNAKWIIVRRKPTEIIQSCLQTGYMKAFKNKENLKQIGVKTEEEGWKWMIDRYNEKFVELIESGVDAKVIWPHRFVYGDYSQAIEVVRWIGLEWNRNILPIIDVKFVKVRRRNGVG